jgi:hypothetical protein
MNPVDQRSEFCRPETAKSVDQRSTAGNSVPAGFSKFSNFAGEFSLRISLRISKILLERTPPPVDLRSTDFAVSVLQKSDLWSTGFSSFSASAPCRPPARINSRDLLNLVLQ